MKKVLTLMIGIVTTATSFSQVSLGIQGTGNLSDAKVESADLLSPKKKMRMLAGAGIVADIQFSPAVAVRTGINYLQNGISLTSSLDGVPGEIDEMSVTGKINLHYLQVPLNVLFTSKGRIQFYAGGGPYFSYALSGKTKLETTIKFADGTVVKDRAEADVFEEDENGETNWRRTDYGVGALAGVKLPGGLFANVGYQFSLANLDKTDESEYRNRGLQLTIGYYLWRK
jgi:hypothetical protein